MGAVEGTAGSDPVRNAVAPVIAALDALQRAAENYRTASDAAAAYRHLAAHHRRQAVLERQRNTPASLARAEAHEREARRSDRQAGRLELAAGTATTSSTVTVAPDTTEIERLAVCQRAPRPGHCGLISPETRTA